MPVVFDASVLVDVFTKRSADDRKLRLDHLISTFSKERIRVLVPSPALAEFLVKAGKARDAYLRAFNKSPVFAVEPFDLRAAPECALLLEEAWTRSQQGKVSRTKFKFDWQIVAIAASRNATAIYSEDEDIAKAAARVRIPVHSTNSLPLPASALQRAINFDESDHPSGSR